ncbi:MAG: hypothetical protein PHU42_02825 [Patescibacteria group bacterium]|nr:hypothetical protein [Patescibacteria group bacterium]
MDQKILQLFNYLIESNKVNFALLYEMFFMGSLTLISIMIVAYFYRRASIMDDLRRIKDASKNVLDEIRKNEVDNKCEWKVYEPALLEPRELQNKLEKNKCKLNEEYCATADRTAKLLAAVRSIEEGLKLIFKKTVVRWSLIIVVLSLVAMILSGYLGFILNSLILVVLFILFIKLLFWDLKEFLKSMDAMPQ